jgi:TonB family protein
MKNLVYRIGGLLLALSACTAYAAETSHDQLPITLSLVRFVRPEFPGIARLEGVAEGSVVVVFSHDLEGQVTDVFALESSHPAFERESVAAVRQWQIGAHEQTGKPCQCAHVIRLVFRAGGIVYLASTPIRAETSSELATDSARPDSTVLTFDNLNSPPKALSRLMPSLSTDSTGKLKNGAVSVTFFVDKQGRVRVPSIVSTPDLRLGQSLAKAMLQWRYEPPQKHGKAVTALAQLTLGLDADSKSVVAAQTTTAGDQR